MHKLVNGLQVPLTEQEILEAQERDLEFQAEQAELALTEYQRQRKEAYPPIEEMVVALIEKYGEDRPDMFNALMSVRAAVKEQYPKPE